MARGFCLKLILVSTLLTGCASSYRVATIDEVTAIPDDCKNKSQIISLLELQTTFSKPLTESERDFDAQQSAIKSKIWHLRYRCQPV